MYLEIHEFCNPGLAKRPKMKLTPEERCQAVQDIINRVEKPRLVKELGEMSGDPLGFIPNYIFTLDEMLETVPHFTNKVVLNLCWDTLPFFRNHHNLLLSKNATFIRRSNNPKGLLVHMHYEKVNQISTIWGYCLIDNPYAQEISMITITYE